MFDFVIVFWLICFLKTKTKLKTKIKHWKTKQIQETIEPEPEPETVIHMNQNRYELELVWTGTGVNRNRSGSIITAHLINDKNTSIAETCIVFNGKSAGNNPRWIYWSYEFLFFRPWGLRTRRLAQTGPGCQNLAFQRFDPMILCSFLWRIRWTTLENHRTKQMMVYVYEQITFFIKNRNLQNLILLWKIDFWTWKQVSGHAWTVPDFE